MRDLLDSALKEVKEIGPFSIGKFEYENGPAVHCRVSRKERYENGCECDSPFFQLNGCFVCEHTCILEGYLSSKNEDTDNSPPTRYSRLNRVITGNGVKRELIYAIYHIARHGSNLNRLVQSFNTSSKYSNSNSFYSPEDHIKSISTLTRDLFRMCNTVYKHILSITSDDDAFRRQLRICYDMVLSKAERLRRNEAIIQCKFTLRLLYRCFLDQRVPPRSGECRCIIDIAGHFLYHFYANTEPELNQKCTTPSSVSYDQHELVSLRLILVGVIQPVIRYVGHTNWAKYFFQFRSARFITRTNLHETGTNQDEIFLSLCLGVNVFECSTSDVLNVIQQVNLSYIKGLYQKYQQRQQLVGSGFWPFQIHRKGNLANLAVQELLKKSDKRQYPSLDPILSVILNDGEERSAFINLLYNIVNHSAAGLSLLENFDMSESVVMKADSFYPFLAKKITPNYLLLLVKIISPALFHGSFCQWVSARHNAAKDDQIEDSFRRLLLSKFFFTISTQFLADLGGVSFDSGRTLQRSLMWYEPIIWAGAIHNAANATNESSQHILKLQILNHDSRKLHFPLCCRPYFTEIDNRLITKSSCYYAGKLFPSEFASQTKNCPIGLIGYFESKNSTFRSLDKALLLQTCLDHIQQRVFCSNRSAISSKIQIELFDYLSSLS